MCPGSWAPDQVAMPTVGVPLHLSLDGIYVLVGPNFEVQPHKYVREELGVADLAPLGSVGISRLGGTTPIDVRAVRKHRNSVQKCRTHSSSSLKACPFLPPVVPAPL